MKVILTQKVVAVLGQGGLRTGNKTALVDSGVFFTLLIGSFPTTLGVTVM